MRLRTSLLVSSVLLLVTGASLAAQKAADSTTWRFTVAPYFWYAGLTGDVGVGTLATHVDLSPSDVIDRLKFGVMIYGEARVQRYVFGLDGLYINLGGSKAVAIRGDTGSFALDQKETMFQPSAGVTFGDSVSGFDVLASIRYWHLSTTLTASGPRGNSVSRNDTQSWVDALIGARYRYTFIPKYHVVVGGDAGGGGARSTWQAYGYASADALYWLTVDLGYRAIGVDYDKPSLLFDATTHGAFIALAFKF